MTPELKQARDDMPDFHNHYQIHGRWAQRNYELLRALLDREIEGAPVCAYCAGTGFDEHNPDEEKGECLKCDPIRLLKLTKKWLLDCGTKEAAARRIQSVINTLEQGRVQMREPVAQNLETQIQAQRIIEARDTAQMLDGLKRDFTGCKFGDAKCVAETRAYDTGFNAGIEAAKKMLDRG